MKSKTVYVLTATTAGRKVFIKSTTDTPSKHKLVSESTYFPDLAVHYASKTEAGEILPLIKSIHEYKIEPHTVIAGSEPAPRKRASVDYPLS